MRRVVIYSDKKRLTGSYFAIIETVAPFSAILTHGYILHVEVSTGYSHGWFGSRLLIGNGLERIVR